MSTTVQAGATAPAAGPTGRLAHLLVAAQKAGGTWTTNRVIRLYQQHPNLRRLTHGQLRAIARGDLRDLAAWGYLAVADRRGFREYTVNTRKDVRL